MGVNIGGRCCGRNLVMDILRSNDEPPTPPPIGPLRLTYSDLFSELPSGITDLYSVSEWNAKLGGNYTTVTVDEGLGIIDLEGGSNVTLIGLCVAFDTFIVSVEDLGSSVVAMDSLCFAYAFSNIEFTTVSLPYCLTGGSRIFDAQVAITTVNLPLMSSTGILSFTSCQGLVNITLNSLLTVPEECFYLCPVLETVTINAATIIDDQAFAGCPSLTTVTMPNVITINLGAFSTCPNLNNVIAPLCLSINNLAFFQNTSLTTYDFSSVFELGFEAFKFCTAMTTADFPACTATDDEVFNGCTALTSILLPICEQLGNTVGDDLVFTGITTNVINMTIPVSRATCNGGNPDGDIQYLEANNTVTVTYV